MCDLRSMISGMYDRVWRFVSAFWIPSGGCIGFCLFYAVMMSITMFCVMCTFYYASTTGRVQYQMQ